MGGTGSLILVHLVERQPEGHRFRRSRSEWPLHVTVIPWFRVPGAKRLAFFRAVERYAKSQPQFSVTVGADAAFGHNSDIPVNLIVEQEALRDLHEGLLDVLRQFGTINTNARAYIQGDYRAHITHHTKDGALHRLLPGDRERIDSITIAQLVHSEGQEMVEIMHNFLLGSSDEAAA